MPARLMKPVIYTRTFPCILRRSSVAPLFQISICTFSCLYATSNITLAQVTADGTVNTQVNQNGNVAEVTGGETRGSNLFHSFQDFSVGIGNEAFFNNTTDISNIFSRVTGGRISNIDGLIRANGSASLFLINPAGIIFGEGARLDLGGSFYGSTASSILFEGGEFSAADLENPPLLTINAPIGLNFRDNPGDIVNRSLVEDNARNFVGLEVLPGKNLTLLGGNINFEEGEAKGGNIELGGLSQAGIVGINEDGSLNFPQNIARADINLSNASDVDVRGTGGGSITINARNLNLNAGDSGSSFIRAGIITDSTSVEAQAEDITINASGNVTVDNSYISNQVNSEAEGNAGGINIITSNLSLSNGGQIDASVLGRGNAGSVVIDATDTITIDGEALQGRVSGAFSRVNSEAEGNAGGINITTSNLSLSNGGRIDASVSGRGNAGSVVIDATDTITIDGETSQGFSPGVFSRVNSGAEGNAKSVNITTTTLNLRGGLVSASTFGRGNAGSVVIDATDTITIDGETSGNFIPGIFSQVGTQAEGDAGGINITTSNLSLSNGGRIDASVSGRGNAGSVVIDATDTITIDGETSQGFSPGVFSRVNSGAEGNAKSVSITTTTLNLRGGLVSASTFGRGNAGSVVIDATDTITIDGETSGSFIPGLFSQVGTQAEGDAGGINITTNFLTMSNGGVVAARTLGTGNGGNINIEANSLILSNEAKIDSVTQSATGNNANIDLQITKDLTLRNNALISASASQQANGGNLDIDARFIIAFPDGNNDIIANAQQGNGGNININAESLFGIQERSLSDLTNDINASSEFSLDGSVTINTPDINPVQGITELPSNVVQPEQTTTQACAAKRKTIATNELRITGKGGIPPSPDLPLNSHNIFINGETSTIPLPVETSRGKIQPARGIAVTESGKVILTAYRTNNSGERIAEFSVNCGHL